MKLSFLLLAGLGMALLTVAVAARLGCRSHRSSRAPRYINAASASVVPWHHRYGIPSHWRDTFINR
jgi:hypothetical protein